MQGQINAMKRRCAAADDPNCRWLIAWRNLSSFDRTWTIVISACESGRNIHTDTGNGFLSAFQWVLSTWHMASGERGSPVGVNWHKQAVIAVRWRNRTNTMQWPACSVKNGYA